MNDRCDELDNIVLETSGRLDVFEKINLRIAETNAEIKILEDHVEHENKMSKSRMHEIED